MFVLGCPDLLVIVDHQLLTRIFSDQALENMKNLRLFNFKKRTLMYEFRIKYRSGQLNAALDCASRYPAGTPSENTREDDRVSAGQAQQDPIHKLLETVTVYLIQTINSVVKATFASMYESDPRLKAITWERTVAAVATDEEC